MRPATGVPVLVLALAPMCAWAQTTDPDTPTMICVGQGAEERESVLPLRDARGRIATAPAYEGPCAAYGPPAVIGRAQLRTYAQFAPDGRPHALGIVVPGAPIPTFPSEPSDGFRCLDVNDDGELDLSAECVGGHERVLFFPERWTEEVESPFRWALFNWNPKGHGPPGIWDVPHFDFHFFIQSLQDRNGIRIGRCAMLVNCDDLEAGQRPVPPRLLPDGYEDRGVVEFGMGNHLIDPATFGSPGRPATQTLIYGAWGGEVSFIEPMVTLAYLEDVRDGREPSTCFALKQADDVARTGFFPTRYCVRYRPGRDEYAVSLEAFEYRYAAGSGDRGLPALEGARSRGVEGR